MSKLNKLNIYFQNIPRIIVKSVNYLTIIRLFAAVGTRFHDEALIIGERSAGAFE